jgi:hypothetical protein
MSICFYASFQAVGQDFTTVLHLLKCCSSGLECLSDKIYYTKLHWIPLRISVFVIRIL